MCNLKYIVWNWSKVLRIETSVNANDQNQVSWGFCKWYCLRKFHRYWLSWTPKILKILCWETLGATAIYSLYCNYYFDMHLLVTVFCLPINSFQVRKINEIRNVIFGLEVGMFTNLSAWWDPNILGKTLLK